MTIKFNNVYVENVSTVAGPFVIEGPLKDISFGISADLMNQLTISNFVYSNLNIPFLGVYNACASVCEEILIAASILENEKNKKAICTTSSHNMTSERQFRNPVEYGAPKPKTTTFTVTGAASLMLTNAKTDIKVTSATIGKVIDMGVDNVFDMGAVMSPSAAYTLNEHLKQTKTKVSDYDLILTGDLGVYGKDIFKEICEKEYNIKLDKNYDDTATMIYDYKENIYAGGSGPACMPLVVYSSIIPKMKQRIIKKVLLIATGALMSPTTCNQKFSIPSVSHAVCLEVI